MLYLNSYPIFLINFRISQTNNITKYHWSEQSLGGAEEDRTPDPLRARQVLSQLSYDPQSIFS